MSNQLGDAFKTLEEKSPPAPPEVDALTFSERRLFDKAIEIYNAPPDAAEIRAAFHCSKVMALKIQSALTACFRPVEKQRTKKRK